MELVNGIASLPIDFGKISSRSMWQMPQKILVTIKALGKTNERKINSRIFSIRD